MVSTSSQPLPSFWLRIARPLEIIIICLTVGMFIMSIPLNYEQRSQVCAADPCPPGQLTYRSEASLAAIGLSTESLVRLTIALDVVLAVVFTTSALVIFLRKPNDPLTIFVTIMLVTFGMATVSGGIRGIGITHPLLSWLTSSISLIGGVSMLAFLYVFPNGRFVPRGSILVVAGWALIQIPRAYQPDSPFDLSNSYPGLYNLLFTLAHLGSVLAQIHRYRNLSTAVEKQQTKWVLYGVILSVGGYLAIRIVSTPVEDPMGTGLPLAIAFNILSVLLILILPVSITIAVLRYRLWDINPIINRTLVYGALSASTIALYVLAVGLTSRYFQEAGFLVAFLATGVIAVLFEPLRERLQRAVNRMMYGDRDDPATVLTQLSQRIDAVIAPDTVLQTIVETLAQTLRLPYAAITLDDETTRFASDSRLPPPELISLPLTYQTERVGELTLAPRAQGESFSTADMNLLKIIAKQAGIAAYNLRLTRDLQRSREKLVTAQEEERRRLRRDLHDGVGPTLASLSQRLDVAADLVHSSPEESVQMLKELKGQVRGAVAEIRRLVYALRPAALDEFGLITAIREHMAPYRGPNGLQISLDVPEPMPPLPAAVEVATYRIALEAFTNIVNHAGASQCSFTIRVDGQCLFLEILDNGRGLPAGHRAGIGLSSMRERAAELGGECTVENRPAGGARVRARIPLALTQGRGSHAH